MTTVYTVHAATVSTLLLNASPTRKGALIYNDSNSLMYLKLGSNATHSDYSIRVLPNQAYDVPSTHTGDVFAVWGSIGAGVGGLARVSDIQ